MADYRPRLSTATSLPCVLNKLKIYFKNIFLVSYQSHLWSYWDKSTKWNRNSTFHVAKNCTFTSFITSFIVFLFQTMRADIGRKLMTCFCSYLFTSQHYYSWAVHHTIWHASKFNITQSDTDCDQEFIGPFQTVWVAVNFLRLLLSHCL